jgi:hypothetical protein
VSGHGMMAAPARGAAAHDALAHMEERATPWCAVQSSPGFSSGGPRTLVDDLGGPKMTSREMVRARAHGSGCEVGAGSSQASEGACAGRKQNGQGAGMSMRVWGCR